ncbi:hypothetical protein RchiOBHm_Chr5g0043651 [Rosa chinensis]|uniref:Uncharacterized protein n=1 Tax=Rosa chinensis TaxID=74649 RepID=A0A2P6QDD5_ROSCH|nr:hypothetical protein RchiOBHm_Chr5g0043651 [Rosa chinensis]
MALGTKKEFRPGHQEPQDRPWEKNRGVTCNHNCSDTCKIQRKPPEKKINEVGNPMTIIKV